MNNPWIICPVCEGNGTVVNPNIDDNGLTADDFAEDPDFADDYMSGVYDVTCNACGGSGKMRKQEADEFFERHYQQAEDRRLAALENGDFDAYAGAGDIRWSR